MRDTTLSIDSIDNSAVVREQWVAIPGFRLFTRLEGSQPAGCAPRLPSIVLEAGGGAHADWWAWVQRHLARHTAVLAYDRAGLGRSAGGGNPPRADIGAVATARRLHNLLQVMAAQSLPPPYLLVGHSLGGLYAQAYASAYPEQVCGVALVDHTLAPQRGALLPRLMCTGLSALAAVSGAWASLRPAQRWRWTRNAALKLAGELPGPARASIIEALNTPLQLSGALREIGALHTLLRWVARQPLPLGLPILCVSAGRRSGTQARARNSDQQAQRQQFSQRIAGAGYLQIDEADHASLLTHPEHAARLADALLAFGAVLPLARPTPGLTA
jgi:pimeloyl-ACP methyl ester carboxylesterase